MSGRGLKWYPENMSVEQRALLQRCPKAVLMMIAHYLAVNLVGEDQGKEAAFERVVEEWNALAGNRIVPNRIPILFQTKNRKPKP